MIATLHLLFLLAAAAAQDAPIKILPPGACVTAQTMTIDRAGAEQFFVCLKEREALRTELGKVPVSVQPTPMQGLPWWSLPLAGGGGIAVGLALGLLIPAL